jgi:hypothetical protein
MPSINFSRSARVSVPGDRNGPDNTPALAVLRDFAALLRVRFGVGVVLPTASASTWPLWATAIRSVAMTTSSALLYAMSSTNDDTANPPSDTPFCCGVDCDPQQRAKTVTP